MVIPIEQKAEMSFVGIMEKYPDDRILVKIIKMDERRGIYLGVPYALGKEKSELYDYGRANNLGKIIILDGVNELAIQGGLYDR